MDKISFFGAIGRMWARIFNYHDKADQREYWFPVIFHGALCFLDCGLFWLSSIFYECDVLLFWIGIVIGAYIAVSIIPGIALTVRRLHATGHKGWWTFLILLIGVGTIWLMVLCTGYHMNGGFFPWENEQPCVYGPPEWFDPSYNQNEDVYGPPPLEPEEDPDDINGNYDPDDNQNGDVYGPPEWFDDNYDPDDNQNEVVYGPPEWFGEEPVEELDPEDNQNVDVYGPPEWFEENYEPDDNVNEVVYGPPEWFEENYEPDDNVNEVVYGPPEWFEAEPEEEINPEDNQNVDVYGPPEWFE